MYSLLDGQNEGEIIIKDGNTLTLNGNVISIGTFKRDFVEEFRFKMTISQINSLRSFLKILQEQPVSLRFDSENNCIWIKEAILG